MAQLIGRASNHDDNDHNDQDTDNDDAGNEILTLKVFPKLLHSEFGVYERW